MMRTFGVRIGMLRQKGNRSRSRGLKNNNTQGQEEMEGFAFSETVQERNERQQYLEREAEREDGRDGADGSGVMG